MTMPSVAEREQQRLAEQARLDSVTGTAERNRVGQFATPGALAEEIYGRRWRSDGWEREGIGYCAFLRSHCVETEYRMERLPSPGRWRGEIAVGRCPVKRLHGI